MDVLSSFDSDSLSDDDEDETAELQRELEKIKRERAEKREQEVRTSFLPPLRLRRLTAEAGTRKGGGRGG